MRIHHLTADEALTSLHTSVRGLSAAEAGRRQAEYGLNRVEHVGRVPLVRRLLAQVSHFFAIVLWLAAGLALAAELWQGGEGMGVLAAAIVAVIIVNALFTFWQEHRSEQALAALRDLLPQTVRVLRDGDLCETRAEHLVPGDILMLRGGDAVPADCRLVAAFGVQANMAAITGESLPVLRDDRPSAEHDLANSANILPAGTAVLAGEAKAVVFATGMRTALGSIAAQTQAAKPTLSPLQREVARLSRLVAVLAAGLGIVFFVVAQLIGMSFLDSMMFAIGIIVANVPEGLLPTVTMALAMAARRLAAKNMLVRHLPAVEALGSVSVICTDKTGTLTENIMKPHSLHLCGRTVAATPAAVDDRLSMLVRHCHSIEAVNEHGQHRLSGDATELALLELAGNRLGALPRIDEVPFDAERRRMSTLHRHPQGLVLYCKGALETVLPLCVTEGGQPLTPARRRALVAAEAEMAARGLHVLALASRALAEAPPPGELERDLDFVALAGLEDPVRAEVPEAIALCRSAGIRVIMITGDHPATAQAVASGIGLAGERPRIITGEQLQRLSETQLQLALDHPEVVFARTRVDQKRRIVAALQAKGEVVAVTGDGINDAPALRQADVGIAMGLSGTEVARQAADMVLVDDNFASIVAAVEEGRSVFDNIRRFLTYILTSNIPQIVPFLAFVLFDVPLALTVIQILAVDLGTDMVPALALAAEKPQPDLMRRPPRRRDQRLVDGALLARAYLFLGPQQAAAAMTGFFLMLTALGWSYGEVPDAAVHAQATTACLGAIVVMQMANLFACRSERLSVLELPLGGNRLIWIGLLAEIGLTLAIVYSPWGNAVFGTAPLPAAAWVWPLPFAALLLASDELRKRALHRRRVAARDRAGTDPG